MNADSLAAFCPAADRFFGALLAARSEGELRTPQRLCMFLAQVAHESAGFTRTVENLNYSADALARTWPKRFAQPDGAPNVLALRLHRDPEGIANHVYANRLGNGPVSSGDGWRFRGRGLIQLTGRDNVTRYARSAFPDPGHLMLHLDLLEQPLHATLSAAWFWRVNGCNAFADAGDLEGLTRRINGGLIGLSDRRKWLEKAHDIFGVQGVASA